MTHIFISEQGKVANANARYHTLISTKGKIQGISLYLWLVMLLKPQIHKCI